MPLTDYTAAELSSLAPEELSALEAADGSNADLLNELAGSAEGEGAAAAAPAGAQAAAAPVAEGGAAAAAPAAGDAAAAPAAAAPAAGPTPAPAPNAVTYRANVGDVAKETQTQKEAIKAARTEKRQALMKLNDGEIDAEEYGRLEDAADARIDSANDKLMALSRDQARSEVAAELTAQQQQSAWKGMLNTYVAQAKTDHGIDFMADEGKRGEFNSLLKAFAQEASDKGMTDDNGMSASQWALNQAAAVMTFRYPKAAAAAPAAGAPAAAPAAGAPAAAPVPAAAALGGLQTLARMPAAAASPVADDVLSKINTLEGEELETYMASLPRDVYQRITAGAQ